MTSEYDHDIDRIFTKALVSAGYLRLGPSRPQAELEAVVLRHEPLLMQPRIQREFAQLCFTMEPTTTSKIDYHGPDDARGHKLSVQVEYQDALSILRMVRVQDSAVREEFVDLAAAAVGLVCDNVRRCPIGGDLGRAQVHSTVRAIVYMPGKHPGVAWHVDNCMLLFISLPAGDDALLISDQSNHASPVAMGVGQSIPLLGGPVPETIMLVGAQAAAIVAEADPTLHAVRSLDRRRVVATHFVWLNDDDLLSQRVDGRTAAIVANLN